jgi:hypothetical protein
MRPIFIVGCPRSGTYLLLKLINTNFDVASPVETHFIPYFRRYLFLYGNLEKAHNRRNLVISIFEFLAIWNPVMMQSRALSDFEDQTLLHVKKNVDQIVKNSDSYNSIIEQIFYFFAKSKNKVTWADKSAFFECVDLTKIVNLPSNPLVIHIVRDGRDVACSWLDTWHGPKNYVSAALRWKHHVKSKRSWGKKNPNRYLELSYEDLVTNPEKILLEVGKFINLPLKNNQSINTKNAFSKTLSRLDSHKLINSDVSKSRIDRFLIDIPNKTIDHVEGIISNTLIEFGYEPIRKEKLRCNYIQLLFFIAVDMFSVNNFYRMVKINLPLLIWLCSIFGKKIPLRYLTLNNTNK